MAPNRKKKKAAANPGRGFATTSTPSKPKPLEDNASVTEEAGSTTSPPANEAVLVEKIPSPDRELHQLTPDELERQLAESELQILVEKHGGKSRKDASHQAARLLTEKRLLRSQADELIVRSWLPEDLMTLIQSYIGSQFRKTKEVMSFSDKISVAKEIPEDEMVIRLWMVEQTLIQMRFSAEQARGAVAHLAMRVSSGLPVAVPGKDSTWGLNECLDWLALTFDASELPDYEVHENVTNQGMPRTINEPQKSINIGTYSSYLSRGYPIVTEGLF